MKRMRYTSTEPSVRPWQARALSGGLTPALSMVVCGMGAGALADTIDVGHAVQSQGAQIEGTAIVVRRHSDGQMWVSNPKRTQQRFSPASTSKIPHTLIALEAGIATPSTVFAWDGFPKGVSAWNRDQTLKSAFEVSAVWVYQQIARTAGRAVMADGLARFSYGNQTVGTDDHLTTYWLDGTLQISAVEQVDFLSRLAFEQLPLSKATYASARDIMVSAEGDRWVMWSKTGWRHSADQMDVGWFVGWVDCGAETYVFALNMDIRRRSELPQRKETTYSVLEDIGAFDCA